MYMFICTNQYMHIHANMVEVLVRAKQLRRVFSIGAVRFPDSLGVDCTRQR